MEGVWDAPGASGERQGELLPVVLDWGDSGDLYCGGDALDGDSLRDVCSGGSLSFTEMTQFNGAVAKMAAF